MTDLIELRDMVGGAVAMRNVPDERLEMMRTHPEVMRAFCSQYGYGSPNGVKETLAASGLYWVSPEMTTLIDTASRHVPMHRLHPDDIISPFGICFFAHPLDGINTEEEVPVSVSAMSWNIGYVETPTRPAKCVWIVSWARFKDGESVAHEVGHWCPNGIAGWVINQEQGQTVKENEMNDLERASHIEDCSRLLTFFLLATQGRLASVDDHPLDRAQRRRSLRAGASIDLIKVVELCRPKAQRGSSGEADSVEWSHRWIVDGHWRNQPWGPGRTRRRPVWIAPYVKGPEDKPLVIKETVKVLN